MRKSIILFVIFLVALVGFAQGIKIAEPQDGATVKGEVPIRIEGAERGYAFITVDGEFLAAINLPAVFKWDTQAPFGFRRKPIQDGEHTISVKVYDGTELLGEAQVKVTVKNKIEFPAGEAVKLAYVYKEGEEHTWKTKASREGVELRLQWKELCNEILQPKGANPVILLTDRVESGGWIYQNRGVVTYPGVGNYFFLSIFPNGEKADILSILRTVTRTISPSPSSSNLFGWGQLRITFPDTGVKLDEPWQSSLVFVAELDNGEPHIALGTHKIEDVVWVKSYKCLKIRSTFEWRGDITLGAQMAGGTGMMPGMMGPGAMGPGSMGPGGMMPGMMGPGGMGPGGLMPGMRGSGAPQAQVGQGAGAGQQSGAGGVGIPGMIGAGGARTTIPVSVEGTRITYFAFEEGKIVKVEDEIRVRPRVGRGEEGTTSTGTGGTVPGIMGPGGMMPGMMGPGAMGPGAMGPGGMMPGMMPGGAMPGGMMPEGMMPGGAMPGMMGPGAMGPGAMGPGGMTPGMMGPGAMGPGAMGPGGMMPGMMGPGAMGPGSGMGMTSFAGGPTATPAGRAMGPFMAGPTTGVSTTYTLTVVSEMIR